MNNLYSAELHIPRSSVSIAAAQDVFRSMCENLGISDDITSHIDVAIEESLTHLFEYAMDKDSNELLCIRYEFAETEMKIAFIAPGRPFNFDSISKYDYEKAFSQNEVEGLGLFLLQSIMDVVQWKYLEKKGQELVIIRKLPSPFAPKEIKSSDFISGVHGTAPGAETVESIEYRVVNTYADAFAVTSCAYDLYHYDYKDVIYYPNELLSRNQNGLMRSWIAVDAKGTVLGHYALMKKNREDTFAETGAAFVRPEMRKAGVFKELAQRLHADAVGLELRGLFSLSVTNHIATQKLSEQYGRITAGIRIASSPAVFVEGAKPGDRTTTTLNYKQIVGRPARDLFIPPRYRDIILSTYSRLQIVVREGKDPAAPSGGDGSHHPFFDTYRDMTWKRAVLSARGGEVVAQKLQAFTDVLLDNGIVCIVLSIDLEDPSAPALAEAAVETGYFYSGVFPESFPVGHDAVQMQLLHNVNVDPSSIHIYQESGKNIYEFIRNEATQIFPASSK